MCDCKADQLAHELEDLGASVCKHNVLKHALWSVSGSEDFDAAEVLRKAPLQVPLPQQLPFSVHNVDSMRLLPAKWNVPLFRGKLNR
jgi:hypothetical protein